MKKENLLMDEFSPADYFKVEGNQFSSVPHGVLALPNISTGAKLLYGALFTLGSTKHVAFAGKKYLQELLGNPSKSTLFRWQVELKNEGLIRVLQRGKGASNIYYFLRHPALGNATEGEFEPGPRPLYRDRQYNTQTIVSEADGLFIYEDRLRDWYEASCAGVIAELPKPGFKIQKAVRQQLESKYIMLLAEAVALGKAVATSTDVNDFSVADGVQVAAVNHVPIDYDSIFSNSNPADDVIEFADTTGVEDVARTLSDEPVEYLLPSGRTIKGPSSRACYLAAMKRRAEKLNTDGKNYANQTNTQSTLLKQFLKN